MNCKAMQRMKAKEFRQGLRLVFLLASCMIIACFFTIASIAGQSRAGQSTSAAAPRSVISLAPSPKPPAEIVARRASDSRFENASANYHVFPAATAGENNGVEELTLNFAGSTTVTGIKSTNRDFVIEPGGTCQEGDTYRHGESCSLLVRFNPQGPGHRLGFVSVTHSAAATPENVGLMGNGYAPVVSFLPAQITTVPATISSGAGIISGATSLAIDGGDILYIDDVGNDLIREIDSSGALSAINPDFATPASIAVDSLGDVYSTNVSGSTYYFSFYTPFGGQTAYGTPYSPGTCTPSAPCSIQSVGMSSAADISIDANDNLFLEERTEGAVEMPEPEPNVISNDPALSLWYLSDAFAYASGSAASFAVDAESNLYTAYFNSFENECFIVQESPYSAETAAVYNRVAGDKCGFSGDGGQARGAEISSTVGQIAFDSAGNMYFSDEGNQRVRRVDATTGIIHTIAGNGTAGDSGDGGKATAAKLNNPTGLAVNSQGAVYIISSATTGQVIRQVGPLGYLTFGNQGKGVASAAQLVTVSNTGNSAMTLTNAEIIGANKGDFKIDSTTTTCILTQGTELNSGQTCRIGVIFTPAVVGARTATLTLLDNTANGADSVTLTGTGVLSTPTFTITAPANGASFTSGTAVTFSVSVTSSTGVQPTGTVQFKVDGTNHGTAVTLSATGTASTSVTGLTTASHTLSATYSGDGNYAAAGPISVSITVKAAAAVKLSEPTTTQKLSSTSAVDLVSDVTSKSTPAPTGKVMFSVDGKCVATAAIVSGKASATGGKLAAGTHTVMAVYSGDAHHSAAKASEEITVAP
jgi:Bacterial Ig-like domain (group 3)